MFGESQKWQNILPIPKLENFAKMHWTNVLEAQMVSVHRVTLFFFVRHTLWISYYLVETDFEGKHFVKIFWDGFKIQNSLSKVETKTQYSTHSRTWKCWKMYWAHVLEAQMVSLRRMALIFSCTHSLDIVLHCKILFGGQKLLENIFRWL